MRMNDMISEWYRRIQCECGEMVWVAATCAAVAVIIMISLITVPR